MTVPSPHLLTRVTVSGCTHPHTRGKRLLSEKKSPAISYGFTPSENPLSPPPLSLCSSRQPKVDD